MATKAKDPEPEDPETPEEPASDEAQPEEGLVGLVERVTDDLDVDRLLRLSGQERERAVASPVVDLGDRRPVRRGVIDGDRLLARSRKSHGEPRVRVTRVPFEN